MTQWNDIQSQSTQWCVKGWENGVLHALRYCPARADLQANPFVPLQVRHDFE